MIVKKDSGKHALTGKEQFVPVQDEHFYRSLFGHALDGILITNEEGFIHFASPSVQLILGYQPEELTGNMAFEYVHPDDRKIALAAFLNEVSQTPLVKFISIRLKKKSGDWLWCVVRGHNLLNVENIRGIAVYFYDDTLRKNAKDALVESEERSRQQAIILNNVNDLIITTDLERRITKWNKITERISGIPEHNALGKFFDDVLKIVFIGCDQAEVMDLLSKEGIWKGEIRFTGANGIDYYFLLTLSLLYGEEKKPFGLLGVGKDITQRKSAEQRLKRSEEEFRNLIQNLSQGVLVQDSFGKIIVCNKAAQTILELDEKDLLGGNSFEKRWDVVNEDGKRVEGKDYPASVSLQTKKPVHHVIIGVKKAKSNDRVWLMVNADPTLDEHGELINIVVTFSDITEQRRLSKELIEHEIQKQKLLTQATIDGQEKERLEMGKELHDNINQHLNTTRLYLEVAREKATGPVREMINFSHKALADIIDKIRFLSQSLVPPTLGDIGLVESIQDVCDSLKRTHKFHVDFWHRQFNEEGLPENLLLMIFRITQEQVNNIIRHSEAKNISIKLESDAEYVILVISDDGNGFDPTNYKKGLGITNITNRASLFNGVVEIEAAKGKGCKLTVTIPFEENNNLDDMA